MVAVELCLRTLVALKMSKVKVVIRSDNMGVVGALKKSCSRGSEQNYILGKIIGLMQAHTIWVECVWISTHDNPADGPSRGVFPPRKKLYHHPPAIPSHLKSLVYPSVTPQDPRLPQKPKPRRRQ
ncbi:hypothetical protein F5880DRAFT_1480054 [Lentinula raphanica]|nr:hypothetical protein F5880DRAFT_1480054 [Lentinula raphanica]